VGQHTFTYDNVYGSGGGDDAVNLYPDCVEPLVEGLFKGYNATVFAYGEQQQQVANQQHAGTPTPAGNSHLQDSSQNLPEYETASATAA
jgi:kinesin family protein 4/21/27